MLSDCDAHLSDDPGEVCQEGADHLSGVEPDPVLIHKAVLCQIWISSQRLIAWQARHIHTDSVGGSEVMAAFNRDTVKKVLAALNVSPVSNKKLVERITQTRRSRK